MKRISGSHTIQEWMLDLNLKPTELIAYAIVYNFSQDGKSIFFGGLDYIMKWCGISRNAACSVMNRLVKKGLIEKQESREGVIKYTNYRANLKKANDTINLYQPIQKTCMGQIQKTSTATIQETCIRNKNEKIKIENNNGVKSIFDR